MNKWIAEFELEDGDTMPEHMDLEYKGAKLDFHCRPKEPCEDCISRQSAINEVKKNTFRLTFAEEKGCEGHVAWSAEAVYGDVIEGALLELSPVTPKGVTVTDFADKCRECGREKVLDKIRAEIEKQGKWLLQAGYTPYNMDIAFDAIKAVIEESEDKK